MLCNEPILNIYLFTTSDFLDTHSYLQVTNYIEFYAVEGDALVFETENRVITIGYDGVKLHFDKAFLSKNHGYLIPYEDEHLKASEDYETTLFRGAHIVSYEESLNSTVVCFDSFCITVYKYSRDDDYWFNCIAHTGGGYRKLACDHLLTKKCVCGGKGEAYLDFVGDYIIRCNKCHASTYACMCFKDVLSEWNDGELPITLELPSELFFKDLRCKRIKSIKLCNGTLTLFDKANAETDCIYIDFDDAKYKLTTQHIKENGDDNFATMDCLILNLSSYSADSLTEIRALSGDISFLNSEFDFFNKRELYFKLDDTELCIRAEDSCLSVFIPDHKLAQPRKRNVLFI